MAANEAGVEQHILNDLRNADPWPTSSEDEVRDAALGDALRAFLFAYNQQLADRIFERIEKRIADAVDHAAKRVVPKNIRGLVEVVVNLRTARIDGELLNFRTTIAAMEQRLMAEIARTIETPFPDPAPEPKMRRARSKPEAKRKSRKS